MKLRYGICVVAAPALCAGSVTAQVTIPLPQGQRAAPTPANPAPANPTPADPTQADPRPVGPPPIRIPLPGAPLPVPLPTPEPGPVPTPLEPQVPLGPSGRPDINPYNRDIDMTVPMTFQNRSLGEIGVRLTADDRYLIDTPTFLRLMQSLLNEPSHASLTERLRLLDRFEPEDLSETGVQLSYDPSALAVVVVQIAPDQRATQDLFAPPRPDVNDVTLQPASLSAFLNLNLVQSYIWEQDRAGPPTVNFDGAIRVGRFVFEGDAQLGQEFGRDRNAYRFERNYARLVYDEPEDYRRWFLGDLDPEIRGLQSYVNMGGAGVVRQQRRFNTFRAAVLQTDRSLVLQRESTVRFLRNGALYRELRLQPGRYDFSALPLLAGSNDINIQVVDNTGTVQNLGFQQYLDPIDLDPGDFEYGAFLGPTSRRIGGAPDYDGPVAFTGFFRKAFFDKPAAGIGVQLSEDIQLLTAQTQFVLRNGGRLLLDGGASNGTGNGVGFAGGISYEHFIDRGEETDSYTIRADYVSQDFSSLGNPDGINPTSFSLSSQYTRQFSYRILATATASYLKGRNGNDDSYRLGVTGYYRVNDRWTVRAGADYAQFGSNFRAGNGFSVNIGIVFQPDFRRRAEARFESRDELAEISYNQSGLNQLNSVGFGGLLAHQNGNVRAQGYGTYASNRFDAAISHASFGPSLSDFGASNATSVRVGTTLAFADGAFGLGRRVNDSFMLLDAHPNLGNRSVVAGQSLAANQFIGRSGALGAAVNNFISSYALQSVQYDVEDAPTGYDTGPGVVRIYPPYKSGYRYTVGTAAFVSAMGTLARAPDDAVALVGGRVTLLDLADGENPQPIPFFTNSVGRFAIANLLPGRRYLVETYGPNGTVDPSFEFAVPQDSDGLVRLGSVRPGMSN